MNYNKKSRIVRFDPEILDDFEQVRMHRISKGMDKPRELSDRELSRMMRNTNNWRNVIDEMKFKPRRRGK